MAEISNATALLEALLAEEEAKKAAALANIASLKVSLALAKAHQAPMIPIESAPSPNLPAETQPQAAPILRADGPKGRFWGIAKPDALVKLLDDTGAPLSPREMSAILEAEGFPTTHEDPVKSAGWALKKRSEKVGDVLLIGRGKWGLRKWYSEDELELFRRGIGGMGGRDRADHSSKTKAGMAALRANGVVLGRRADKMTPEAMDKIERMILDQKKVADIAVEMGVSKASIYGRFTVSHVNGRQTVERRNQPPSTPLRLVK
jgi:hypothetical protein